MANANPEQPNPQVVYIKEPKKPWYKRIGCMVSLAITVIAIAIIGGCMAITGKVANEVNNDINTEWDITYSIGGDAQGALVTYTVNDGDQTQENGVAAGWSKTVKIKGLLGANLMVTNGANDQGTVTCTVTANGKTVAENKASGLGASASCDASSDEIKNAFK